MSRKTLCVLAVGLWLLAAAATSSAATAQSLELRAALTAAQQVPPQVVKAPTASGRFSGTLTLLANHRGRLTWRLSYARLTSPVTQTYLFVPAAGTQPQVVVQLCRQCKTAALGTISTIPRAAASALSNRRAYVVVRTQKNKKGEIRGLIRRL